jgi:hypothetical protein
MRLSFSLRRDLDVTALVALENVVAQHAQTRSEVRPFQIPSWHFGHGGSSIDCAEKAIGVFAFSKIERSQEMQFRIKS